MSVRKVTSWAMFFLVIGLLIRVCSHLASNYYVNMEKDGNSFSCVDLINDFDSGDTSEFNKIYGSSLIKSKGSTVSKYEVDYDFEFKSCRSEIDLQKEDSCKIKKTKITPGNFNSKIEDLEKYCDFTKADFVSNFENQTFELIEGENTLLKYENKSKPIRGMSLWEPFKAHSPDNGLYRLCIVDEYANCNYFKSKLDAEKEHERLLKYLAKG